MPSCPAWRFLTPPLPAYPAWRFLTPPLPACPAWRFLTPPACLPALQSVPLLGPAPGAKAPAQTKADPLESLLKNLREEQLREALEQIEQRRRRLGSEMDVLDLIHNCQSEAEEEAVLLQRLTDLEHKEVDLKAQLAQAEQELREAEAEAAREAAEAAAGQAAEEPKPAGDGEAGTPAPGPAQPEATGTEAGPLSTGAPGGGETEQMGDEDQQARATTETQVQATTEPEPTGMDDGDNAEMS